MKAMALFVILVLFASIAFSGNKMSAAPNSLDYTGTMSSPSTSQSYVLANSGPGAAIPMRITPSTHTEVSLDNISFSATPLTVSVSMGPGTTVYVRVVTASAIVLNETITNIGTVDDKQTASVTITGDIPLPITLSSFRLNLSGDFPVLTWKTISEIDNYGFYVQKSQDMANWTEIATSFQHGYGTTAVEHDYTYTDNTLPAGNFYRLHQVDLDGASHYSDAVSVVASVEPAEMVREFALEQNYPNPFNPRTTIKSSVGGTGGQGPGASVKLVVYDLLGREVKVLVNERRAAGFYEDTFDGSGLASGVYVYRLTAGSFVQSQRMVLLK